MYVDGFVGRRAPPANKDAYRTHAEMRRGRVQGPRRGCRW